MAGTHTREARSFDVIVEGHSVVVFVLYTAEVTLRLISKSINQCGGESYSSRSQCASTIVLNMLVNYTGTQHELSRMDTYHTYGLLLP